MKMSDKVYRIPLYKWIKSDDYDYWFSEGYEYSVDYYVDDNVTEAKVCLIDWYLDDKITFQGKQIEEAKQWCEQTHIKLLEEFLEEVKD